MFPPLSQHPSVVDDLAEIHGFIAIHDATAAMRVLDAIGATVSRISENPQLGPIYPVRIAKLRGIRMLPVSENRNYLVFYRDLESETRILYVFHGARNIPKLIRTEIRE